MIPVLKKNYFAIIILICAALYISMHIHTYNRLTLERQSIIDSFRLINNSLSQARDSLYSK
ncbi:MAG: hypothetical protein J0I41_00635 [Filimonas sp.]|nr:hypothetical protein [Filimonas sp.]